MAPKAQSRQKAAAKAANLGVERRRNADTGRRNLSVRKHSRDSLDQRYANRKWPTFSRGIRRNMLPLRLLPLLLRGGVITRLTRTHGANRSQGTSRTL